MLIGNIEIALGQVSTHPDCKAIHYTDNQDKRCLECLINRSKRDSLHQIALLNIEHYKSIVSEYETQKSLLMTSNIELGRKLGISNKKLKFSLSLNKFGIPITLGCGVLVGILIAK